MHDKNEKYKRLSDKTVMNNFIYAILMQSIKDINGKVKAYRSYKLDAIYFLKSEFCELMCGVTNKDYNALHRIATDEARKFLGERKDT